MLRIDGYGWRILLVGVAWQLAGLNGWTGEPQVSFALTNGWVTCRVIRDDQPVANATVQIIDGNGHPFASGDASEKGVSEFPLPRTDSFFVQIQIADKSADLIRLEREGDGLFPREVLLTFGLTPCCHVPVRGAGIGVSNIPFSGEEYLITAAFAIGILVGGAIAIGLVFWGTSDVPVCRTSKTRLR